MRTTVFFATNRPVANAGTALADYGAGIVPPSDPGQVTYASAFIDGTELDNDSSGRVISLQDASKGRFGPGAAGDLAAPGRNILVFVHGFDNSFEDAITRAAYNREWMAASGAVGADMAVVTFSWPSLGELLGPPLPQSDYLRDQTMAGQSGQHVMAFFEQLRPVLQKARATGAKCYLLCHSMGNWVLQAAVESWFAHQTQPSELFDEVILAAADERFDSFAFPQPGRLSGLPHLARRISIYYSTADAVLGVSALVNGTRRLGQDGPRDRTDAGLFPPGKFRMIDCAGFTDYPQGFGESHQYYRRSPGVRADIISIL